MLWTGHKLAGGDVDMKLSIEKNVTLISNGYKIF